MSAKIQKYGYLSLFLLPSLGFIKKKCNNGRKENLEIS